MKPSSNLPLDRLERPAECRIIKSSECVVAQRFDWLLLPLRNFRLSTSGRVPMLHCYGGIGEIRLRSWVCYGILVTLNFHRFSLGSGGRQAG